MATPGGTRGDRQARQVRLLLLLFFFLLSSFLLLTRTIYLGSPDVYRKKLEGAFEGNEITFIVEKKADANYAPCSAASVGEVREICCVALSLSTACYLSFDFLCFVNYHRRSTVAKEVRCLDKASRPMNSKN